MSQTHSEAPLDCVAQIARDVVVPTFRKYGVVMSGAMSTGTCIVYLMELGSNYLNRSK